MSTFSAAWHRLPDDPTTLRYWDGQQWTNHFRHWDGYRWADGLRPAEVTPPTPPAPPNPAAQQPQQQPVQQAPSAHPPARYAQPHQQAPHGQHGTGEHLGAPAQAQHAQQQYATPLQAQHAQQQYATPLQAQQQYAAPAQPQKRKRSHAVWIIPVAAVTVLLLATGGVYFGLFYGNEPETIQEVAAEEQEYRSSSREVEAIVNGDITHALTAEVVYTDESRGLDYTTPIVNIEERETQIEVPLGLESFQPEDRPSWATVDERLLVNGEGAAWAVRAYADADLTTEIALIYYLEDGIVRVGPNESAMPLRINDEGEVVPEFDFELTELGLTDGTPWGMRDTYYVVRYVSDDGEMAELERPVVSKLSFAQSMTTPSVQVSHSSEFPGSLELNWNEVTGAASYGVFVSHLGEDTDLFGRSQVLLGETTGTTWTPEGDGEFTESIHQNYAMNTGEYEASADYHSLGTEYGVMAFDENREVMSGLGTVSANTPTVEALPYRVDFDLLRDWQDDRLLCDVATECTFDDNMTFAPFISLSGTVRTATVQVTDYRWQEEWDTYSAEMSIEGTNLWYWQSLVTDDEDEALELIERFNERAAADRPETGGLNEAREAEIKEEVDVPSPVETEIPDAINTMGHELVGHIASHLHEGHEVIDISDYGDFWSWPEIDRATNVAMVQNPQFAVYAWAYDLEQYTLYIEYRGRERAMEAYDEALAIVEDMNLDSMTDTRKVEEINQYIVDHVEYDYDALDAAYANESLDPHWKAWTLDGAVLDGVVVCVGYAYMFLVMANEAGLEAVYVDGTVDGSRFGHAWNKVKVDGEWKIVDPTWNDGTDNMYLLLDDDGLPNGEVRDEAPGWLMGDLSQYATP